MASELERAARRHAEALVRIGGVFKHEEGVLVASGRSYRQLAVGSGGATCYPEGAHGEWYARRHGWYRAVNPCG